MTRLNTRAFLTSSIAVVSVFCILLAILGPASVAEAAVPALRRVHSGKAMVTDLHLNARSCHLRTLNHRAGAYLPDARCTPGAFDPAVTQRNIRTTICRTGYTSKVRPGSAVMARFKTASLSQYGIKSGRTLEYDHLVSLELGGANSVSNLWVEPNRAGAASTYNPKDTVENALHRAVCSRQVGLAAAQHAIAANWTTALHTLHL
ncbi:hypothetical protein [Arthrobacter sp. SDTb3-6]|uniref:hypothetical protein n=1 Tax=Arthrobacter sp. SDTb3-6 TaxID=2713571 RepID=UPI001C400A57|nr:hypothetical protein [Arthrobacter sp. SDTb3-6]